jgi:2-polyprenyl-3-methyl-5-hydroxy-6-metoxy-1,4-benzoquinol methylase
MPEGGARPAAPPTLADVHDFWNANPLFSGEAHYPAGAREFFEEFERVTLFEHSGAVRPIFLREVQPGRKVLDVGCGVGFWVGQFCRRGAEVYACDLTERAVEITRRRLEIFGIQAEVRVGNAERLPYPDASFDHVNCQGVIHHTPNPQACIAEFHRVLRAGGTLCLSVYYKTLAMRSRPVFRLIAALSRPLLRLHGRGRERMLAAATPEDLVRMYDGAANPIGVAYTRKEFRRLLGPGFVVLEQIRFGFPRRAMPLSVADGVHRLLSNTLGLMIVFRCRKLDTERPKEAS